MQCWQKHMRSEKKKVHVYCSVHHGKSMSVPGSLILWHPYKSIIKGKIQGQSKLLYMKAVVL